MTAPTQEWQGGPAPDAICRCRHFLAVTGGRGHAGNRTGRCAMPGCGCTEFREDQYRPMDSGGRPLKPL